MGKALNGCSLPIDNEDLIIAPKKHEKGVEAPPSSDAKAVKGGAIAGKHDQDIHNSATEAATNKGAPVVHKAFGHVAFTDSDTDQPTKLQKAESAASQMLSKVELPRGLEPAAPSKDNPIDKIAAAAMSPQLEKLFKEVQLVDSSDKHKGSKSREMEDTVSEEVHKSPQEIALDLKKALLDKDDPAANMENVRRILERLGDMGIKLNQVMNALNDNWNSPPYIDVQKDGNGIIDRITMTDRHGAAPVEELYQRADRDLAQPLGTWSRLGETAPETSSHPAGTPMGDKIPNLTKEGDAEHNSGPDIVIRSGEVGESKEVHMALASRAEDCMDKWAATHEDDPMAQWWFHLTSTERHGVAAQVKGRDLEE